MINTVNNRLTTSWLAGVAIAATLLVPLRLGVIERLFTSDNFRTALADYLLTAGVGYFTGVFASLPLMICAGLIMRENQKRVGNSTGLWSVSGALILSSVATLFLHLTPLAEVLRNGLDMRLSIFDTFGFFLVCTGVSAMVFQAYDYAEPREFPTIDDNDLDVALPASG